MGAVLPRLAEAAPEHRVLIVDDNSPDGTGQIADRLAARAPRGRGAPPRRQGGLGAPTSPASSTRWRAGAELILEMDSDFSHDPADLPRLIGAAERRRPGARLALRPGRRRDRLGPRAAAALARRLLVRAAVLGVAVRDLTGGFKCFRREVLEALDSRRRRTPTATASRSR